MHGARYSASAYAAEEEDLCGTGFVFRDVGPGWVRAWLLLQFAGLLAQFALWMEVGGHLDQYELTLEEQCRSASSHHGICLGPMWNLSHWQEENLDGRPRWCGRHKSARRRKGHWRPVAALETEKCNAPQNKTQLTFGFRTHSTPPTFLVAVVPLPHGFSRLPRRPSTNGPFEAPSLGHAHHTTTTQAPLPPADAEVEWEYEDSAAWTWSLRLVREGAGGAGEDFNHTHLYTGHQTLTFEDLSDTAAKAMVANGEIAWQATLANLGARPARIAVFVEDSAIRHLGIIHLSQQCSFSKSWKAFNQQHQGHSHSALTLCRVLLGCFLPVSMVTSCAAAAWHWLQLRRAKREKGGGECNCFHFIVIAKFFLVDVAQQACIVLYVLGWYEAEGLRCQLCLFQPERCEDGHVLGTTTLSALGCCLASSLSHQLLVKPGQRLWSLAKDPCSQVALRGVAASVSVLPVTTAVFWTSSALLATPTFARVAVFLPCCLGWMSVAGFLFCAVLACCEDCK